MSTAFHRRHWRQEPGQGRGQSPCPGQGSPAPALDLVRCPPNSGYSLGTRGVPRRLHSQATQGRDLHPESSVHSATFRDHAQEGSANSIPLLPDSCRQHPATTCPHSPTHSCFQKLLGRATCLNEGGRAEEGRQDRQGNSGDSTKILGFPGALLPTSTPTIPLPALGCWLPPPLPPNSVTRGSGTEDALADLHIYGHLANPNVSQIPCQAGLGVGGGCAVNRPGSRGKVCWLGERVWNEGRGRAQMGIWEGGRMCRLEREGVLSQKQKQGVAGKIGQGSPGVAAGLCRGSRHVGCYHRQGWGPSWQPRRKCLGAPRVGWSQ